MSPTRHAEWKSDERVVEIYRDRFGFPRLEQPDELSRAESAWIALGCAGLVVLVLWVCF